jgi:quercetin dioxygenase-like cupin family protein
MATVPALALDSVKTEVLLQNSRSWDGTEYTGYPTSTPQLTVEKITIPAHTTLDWHCHPMPNAAYVLSGTLTVQKKSTGQEKELVAGEVLAETMNIVHRGFTGNAPVVLLAFYAGTPGMPLVEKSRGKLGAR